MHIEQDDRLFNNRSNVKANIAIALGAMALMLVIGIIARAEWKAGAKTHADLGIARTEYTNALEAARQLFQQRNQFAEASNRKQQFIDETFWHVARFLTNAHVREIDLAPGRISTFVDTNEFYGQGWSVTITSSNLVAKKERWMTNTGSVRFEATAPAQTRD